MSRKLIFGSVSRQRLIGLTPIGVVGGREVFPLQGAEDDPPGNGEGSDSDDDEEQDEEEDESEEDDEDEKAKSRKRPTGKKPADAAFAAMKRELNKLKREKRESEQAEKAKSLQDKPEIERLTVERDDATKERDELASKYREASVELAIVRASNSANSKYSWNDIEDVLNDKALRRAIEIDEDGEISGVAEALKDLAKRKPHFLSKKSEEDDKGGKGTGTKNGAGGSGKTGQQPGNGGGSGDRAADRDRLAKSYPALGAMVQN